MHVYIYMVIFDMLLLYVCYIFATCLLHFCYIFRADHIFEPTWVGLGPIELRARDQAPRPKDLLVAMTLLEWGRNIIFQKENHVF